MEKRIKLISIFVMLIALFGLMVSAQAEMQARFNKGWNLIYGFTGPGQLSGILEKGDIKAVYAFIPTIQEYARAYPNPEYDKLRQVDDDQLLNTAFWVYSSKETGRTLNGVMNADEYMLEDTIMPFEQRQMYKGWNFVGITPDMYKGDYSLNQGYEGEYFSLGEIEGSCNILKSYWYNSEKEETEQGTNWKEFSLDLKIKHYDFDELLGTGLVVKVSDNCKLGFETDAVIPPQIPS